MILKNEKIYEWLVGYDPLTTKKLYQNLEWGCTEVCQCKDCQMFAENRYYIYPKEFLDLLDKFGINPVKEIEVYKLKETSKTSFLFGGCFHFVGYLQHNSCIENENLKVRISDSFELFLSTKIEMPTAEFRKYPLVQLDFRVSIPVKSDNNHELDPKSKNLFERSC